MVVYDKDAGVLDADDPLGGVVIELSEGMILEEEYRLKNEPAKMKPKKDGTGGAQGTVRIRFSVVGDGEPAPPHWTLEKVLEDVDGMLGEVEKGGTATISVLHPCPVIVARKKIAGLTKVSCRLLRRRTGELHACCSRRPSGSVECLLSLAMVHRVTSS